MPSWTFTKPYIWNICRYVKLQIWQYFAFHVIVSSLGVGWLLRHLHRLFLTTRSLCETSGGHGHSGDCGPKRAVFALHIGRWNRVCTLHFLDELRIFSSNKPCERFRASVAAGNGNCNDRKGETWWFVASSRPSEYVHQSDSGHSGVPPDGKRSKCWGAALGGMHAAG